MSEFRPKIEDIVLFQSMSVAELNDLPAREVEGYKKLSDSSRIGLAQLRSALRLFNRLGAIKPSWLERSDMASERMEASADLDERLRDLVTPYVGENGGTEDLVQTLERILEERGNVKRNRERPTKKKEKTMTPVANVMSLREAECPVDKGGRS